MSLRTTAPLIERAIRAAEKRGGHVMLDIDSPGGSPVQSDLIASAIRRQRRQGGRDGARRGAGGRRFRRLLDRLRRPTRSSPTPMSIVGSIGVVGGGFGFTGALARLGVERRLYTAGENKARLDPFSPERPEDVAFVQRLMADLHERFKAWVRDRRGARLQGDEARLFDGSFFLGDEALDARPDRPLGRCRRRWSANSAATARGPACSAPAAPRCCAACRASPPMLCWMR